MLPSPTLRPRALRTRRRPAAGGFSLLELMVTMGLATLLITMGAGVYVKMGRRSAATQAMASVNQLVVRAKNASTNFPASIVASKEENLIQAYTEEVVQELHFEPRATDSGPYVPLGIEGRDCTLVGAALAADAGRVGGGLRVDGGSVSCGAFPAYDVDQGINAEVWIRPDGTPKCDVVSKGRSFGVRLDAFPGRPARLTVRMQVQSAAGAQDRVERNVDLPPVRPGEWLGIRVSYDRSEIVSATNEGFGFVVRDRWKETRRLALDTEAALVVAAGLQGFLDDVRIGGVRAAEPLQLPVGVGLWGANPPIRFADGRLDPAVHTGPARLALVSEGRVRTFVIGQNGTVLAIEETDAPAEPAPGAGAGPK